MSRKTSLIRAGVCAAALLALAAAFGYVDTMATPPSSTAHAGQSYLLWAQASTAKIWVLDANGGLVREHVLPWDARPAPGQTWTPRELMMGPDGIRRLLWTEPSTGRSVAWILDDQFRKVGERSFQASNPAADWYTTNLEKNADGTGRLLWFNAFVGSAVLWGLDANDAKVSTKIYTPAADPGAWVPIDYSRAPDGSARLVWTYVWNGTGPWGGKSAVWFLDGNDQKLGSQVLTYPPDWYLRTYHFGNDGRLRFLLANDNLATGKVCTALTDTTTVPAVEGWGAGKCKTFGPQRGWILRSYTGNLPLDLSAHDQAMIERESQRLEIPEERFLTPTEVRYDDFVLSTDQMQAVAGGGGSLGDLTNLDVKKWPGGRMYLHFTDNSPAFVQKVLDQCQKWASVAGVSCLSGGLTPRLTVYKVNSGPCQATLGNQANSWMKVYDNDYCDTHELGHALGLIHTHQREDRDGYVEIRYQNAVTEGWPHLLDRFRVNYLPGPYDFFSVMHYGPYSYSIPNSGLPTITRIGGGVNLGGTPSIATATDASLMRSLYPGTGVVSPASEFIDPPADDHDFYVSNVNIAGQAYTPNSMPVVNPGDSFSMAIRVTNSGIPWLATDGLSMEVRRIGALNLGGPDPSRVVVPVSHSVATHGQFTIQFGAAVPATAPASAVALRVRLLASNGAPLVGEEINLYISGVSNSTGSAEVVSVETQVGVVPVGQLLPFEVKVRNPTNQPENVRVRGYIGGATVTDAQSSFQARTIDPGQDATFVYSVIAPSAPGPIKAYGQIYTLTGTQPYGGAESADVLVTNPPPCGGCDFTGIPCGEEGRCVNNPAVGCGYAHACGTYCEESADVQLVTTSPNPVSPNSPFTVSVRVKNLATQVNTVSVRGYTDLEGATPYDAWQHDQAMHPNETRTFHFPFLAPASGSFQSHGQVWCAGAPEPFAGNSSAPATVGSGGGTYNGATPTAEIVWVGPLPATAGGSISMYARVHNGNNYTTPFYLRPYADGPAVQELPRLAVSIPPHSDVTEQFVFDVPNAPGAPLNLHFQVEYTLGQAINGNSVTVPIVGPSPSPSPTPSPEDICPGPDDGDTTGCLVDGQGYQSYRTCQSCRSAYPWASSCKWKQNLGGCWKPM